MPLLEKGSLQHISRRLRDQYAQIAEEPLPERWVDLIKYLNERERAEAQDIRPEMGWPPTIPKGSIN